MFEANNIFDLTNESCFTNHIYVWFWWTLILLEHVENPTKLDTEEGKKNIYVYLLVFIFLLFLFLITKKCSNFVYYRYQKKKISTKEKKVSIQ